MTATILIPARYNSTRLPGKLLLGKTGKPLLQYTYEQAKLSIAENVIIATDDQRIKSAAEAFGAQVVMTATTHISGTARIAQALEILMDDGGTPPQIIINLQGDEPEVDPGNINRLIRLHTAYKDVFFASTLACPFAPLPKTGPGSPMDPACVKLVATPIYAEENKDRDPANPDKQPDRPFEARYFSRAPIPYCRDADGATQDPAAYLLHLGIYAFSSESLSVFPKLRHSPLEAREKLEQLRILENGYRIGVGLVSTNAPGIDTREDYDAFVMRMTSG